MRRLSVTAMLRSLHKWLGLLVGLQLILWMLSGVVFAWLDHAEVTARDVVRVPPARVLAPEERIVDPAALVNGLAASELREIALHPLAGRWVYRIERADGVELRAADSSAPLEIDAALAARLAQAHYAGAGDVRAVVHHDRSTLETRDLGPSWQVEFDDPRGTSLYFSAEDGRFLVARNATWRLFDFFWMLHTMDYRGRDDFNNPLVITVATGALWLALSGLLLLFRSFRRRDFAVFTIRKARRPLGVDVQ